MRIPVRFAPIVFGALLSAIMVAIVSAFVLTGVYVAKANTTFDQMNEEILREFE